MNGVSLLKAYTLKKNNCLTNRSETEHDNLKSSGSFKRKKCKKRKISKLKSSRGGKKSAHDSFKLSLFKPEEIGDMLVSLSNLESNASNYSSTTLSPSPKRNVSY